MIPLAVEFSKVRRISCSVTADRGVNMTMNATRVAVLSTEPPVLTTSFKVLNPVSPSVLAVSLEALREIHLQ